jgi:hypothetical protein
MRGKSFIEDGKWWHPTTSTKVQVQEQVQVKQSHQIF